MTRRKTSKSQISERTQRDDALEEYGTAAARFRRNLVVAAVVAVVAVVAVSAGLALHQYRQAQRASLSDLGSRAVVAAGVVDTAFAGDVATLQTIAVAPSFTGHELPRMSAYLHRVDSQNGALFNGGMGWIDTSGIVRISTNSQKSRADRRQRPDVLPARPRNGTPLRQRRPDRPEHRRPGDRRRSADAGPRRADLRRARRQRQARVRAHEAKCARSRLRGARIRRPKRQGAPVGARAGRESGTAEADAPQSVGRRHGRARPRRTRRPRRRLRLGTATGVVCRDRPPAVGRRRCRAALARPAARLGRRGRARRVLHGHVRRRAVAPRAQAA